MIKDLPRQLSADARFYRRLKYPGEPVSKIRALTTALASKGWWLLASHRIAHYSTFNRDLHNPCWWLSRVLEGTSRYLCAIICRSEAMVDCQIIGPVYFSDNGYLMVGAQRIGSGTIIHHRVTIGVAVANGRQDRPIIGNDVWIGPDCVIAGGLHVGDGATVLPGTYLTSSIPPRAVVKGNPARRVCQDFDNGALRCSLKVISELPIVASVQQR